MTTTYDYNETPIKGRLFGGCGGIEGVVPQSIAKAEGERGISKQEWVYQLEKSVFLVLGAVEGTGVEVAIVHSGPLHELLLLFLLLVGVALKQLHGVFFLLVTLLVLLLQHIHHLLQDGRSESLFQPREQGQSRNGLHLAGRTDLAHFIADACVALKDAEPQGGGAGQIQHSQCLFGDAFVLDEGEQKLGVYGEVELGKQLDGHLLDEILQDGEKGLLELTVCSIGLHDFRLDWMGQTRLLHHFIFVLQQLEAQHIGGLEVRNALCVEYQHIEQTQHFVEIPREVPENRNKYFRKWHAHIYIHFIREVARQDLLDCRKCSRDLHIIVCLLIIVLLILLPAQGVEHLHEVVQQVRCERHNLL